MKIKLEGGESVTATRYGAKRGSAVGATLVLGHGAGAGQNSEFMVRFAGGIAARGVEIWTFNFLYADLGRSAPDRADRLEACYGAVIAAVFVWVMVQRSLGSGPLHRSDPRAVGTAGTQDERLRSDNSPGGFNPTPRPGSTADELKLRGSNQTTIARLNDVTTGSRVNLADVKVDQAQGDTFTIRDDDATATVVVPGGMPTVRAGQRVNISGTLEAAGATPRIRASRIEVR